MRCKWDKAYLFLFLVCFISICIGVDVKAEEAKEKRLHFSGSDDANIFVDRLLYYALEDIGYSLTVETQGLISSLVAANSGEADGNFLQVAGMEKEYPNLVMIPEQLCTVDIEVYAKSDSDLEVRKWSELSGKKIGIMYQRPYIEDYLPKDVGTVEKYAQMADLFDALENDEVDVILNANLAEREIIVPTTIKKLGNIDKLSTYAYVNKKYSFLVEDIKKSIKRLKTKGVHYKLLQGQSPERYSKKNILYVSSYTPNMDWEEQLFNSFKNNFGEELSNYELHTVNLNVLDHLDDMAYQKVVTNMLRKELTPRPVDVIFVSDDEALDYIKEIYHMFFFNTPIVFCGTNNFTSERVDGYEELAVGAAEVLSAKDTVDLILKLFPETNHLYILNNYDTTALRAREDIEEQLKEYGDSERLEIEFSENVPFDQLVDKMKEFGKGTVVLNGKYLINDIQYQENDETVYKVSDFLKVPMFNLLLSDMGEGQIGGKLMDSAKQGEIGQSYLKQVLDGKSISDFDVKYDQTDYNQWYFNYEQLKKWNINESDLPQDSIILNKKPTFWEENPVAGSVIIVSACCAIFIIGSLLLFSRKLKNKNAVLIETQKSLHTAEEMIQKDKMLADEKSQRNKMIAMAPIALIVTIDHKIVDFNKYAGDRMGVKKGDLIEMYYESPTMRNEILSRLSVTGALQGEIIKLKMKGNKFHRYYSNITYVDYNNRKSLVLWGMDIEENQRQTELLEKIQNDLQRLIDALPVSVMIMGKTKPYQPLYVNNAYLKLLGYSEREEALKHSLTDIISEDTSSVEHESVEGRIKHLISSNESEVFEWQLKHTGGTLRDTKIVGNEIMFAGAKAFSIVIQDVGSEKRQAEMLKQAAKYEREANEIKSKFVLNMSHEIRTPMNAIIGLSEMALMKQYEKEVLETFKKINMSSKNLLSIVNDVLDFSKIESKTFDLLYEEFLLEDILGNAMLVGAQRLDKKMVEMILHMDFELPKYVFGDKTRLWQILKNILDNSAKFTQSGFIRMDVKLIETMETQDIIEFAITDTGFGMTQEQIDSLFVPFLQYHQNSENATTGTGLGMAITKQLAELMDGTIRVDSELEAGTKTTITIPFKKAAVLATVRSNFSEQKLKDSHIYIVHQEQEQKEVVRDILCENGAKVTEVRTIDQVGEVKQDENIMVVLDYSSYVESGKEKAEAFLEQMRAEKVKVFFMSSSFIAQELYEELKEDRFTGLIEKPFTPTSLLDVIFAGSAPDEEEEVTRNVSDEVDLSGYRVLLCEDNEINQEVALGMLETFGLTVEVANNGKEGIELLEQKSFDLVLMDIIMPVMDGHEAARTIRASDKDYKDIPVIAMTANVIKEEIEQCMKDGMNGHISKPIDYNNLGLQLKKWLQ